MLLLGPFVPASTQARALFLPTCEPRRVLLRSRPSKVASRVLVCGVCLQPRARELYLLDWWFVSSSRAADAFGLVAEPALFANYTLLNQQRLNSPKSGRPVIMGHGVLLWRPHRACVFRYAQPPSRPAA